MDRLKKYLCKENFIKIVFELFAVSVIIIPSITMPMFKEMPFIISKCMTLAYFFELFFCVPLLFGYELLSVIRKLKKGFLEHKKYLIRYLLFIVCIACVWVFTKNTNIICYVFLIYFSKESSIKRLIYIYLVCKLIGLGVIVLSNVFGLVDVVTDGRGISFGVKHSNMMARYLVCMLFAYYCVSKNKKITVGLTLVVFVLCVFVMKSRTPVIILVLFAVMVLLENHKLYTNKFLRSVFVISPLLLTVLSIVLGLLIYNGYLNTDGNMSIRFLEWVSAFKMSGVSLFARRFPGMPYYFDNCYANVFYCYGIVTFVIFILTWINANKNIGKTNYTNILIVSACLCVYCLMEVLIADELIFILLAFVLADFDNPVVSKLN